MEKPPADVSKLLLLPCSAIEGFLASFFEACEVREDRVVWNLLNSVTGVLARICGT